MGLKKSKEQIYQIKNISNINNIHHLEDLSNDLIYEIFDYLSFYEISFAFGNLNKRFKNLIDDYAHYVNMQQSFNQLLPRIIHSLKINARYQLHGIDLSNIGSLHTLILSNLRTIHLSHIINTISLKELKYVYLGTCSFDNETEGEQLGEIQEKFLSLGALKLEKCILRMKFCGNMKQLPIELPFLRYLRIDGCANVLIVNKLLDRMPNLQSLYVSILGLTSLDDHHIEQNNKHQHLTHITIRLYSSISFLQLNSLFMQHGSSIKVLIIYLESVKENSPEFKRHSHHLVNLHQKITTIINNSLPQLTNFQLRQHVLSEKYNFLRQTHDIEPYVEEIPSEFEHSSYRVSIVRHLADLWKNK